MVGDLVGDFLGAVLVLGAVFILGTWYGLYLNLTHWHRMRRWACSVSDALDGLARENQERGK